MRRVESERSRASRTVAVECFYAGLTGSHDSQVIQPWEVEEKWMTHV